MVARVFVAHGRDPVVMLNGGILYAERLAGELTLPVPKHAEGQERDQANWSSCVSTELFRRGVDLGNTAAGIQVKMRLRTGSTWT